VVQSFGARLSLQSALLACRQRGGVPVIPDLKVRSPKEGELLGARSAAEYALAMAEAGAPAISVVTEPKHFGGSLDMLRAVVDAVGPRVPVLRKDFLRTAADVRATAAAGASAVLIIVAQLDDPQLANLVTAAGEAGIESLVEVHSAAELERALAVGFDCLGINNRDIVALERDHGTVSTSEHLARDVPEGIVWISESGIHTPEEARRAVATGATAVLVGTELLLAPDPVRRWRELSGVVD